MSKRKKKSFQIVPEAFFEKIEFNKVRELLIELCKGEETVEYFSELSFLNSPSEINNELAKAKSYFTTYQQDDKIPSAEFFKIENDLFLLSKENYLLEIESLFRINNSILLGHELFN